MKLFKDNTRYYIILCMKYFRINKNIFLILFLYFIVIAWREGCVGDFMSTRD